LGYRTHGLVSLPVLNPKTVLNQGFDSFKLMDRHNDMRAMVRQLKFSDGQPSFYLLNVGETHYPYALPDEPAEQWPRVSGVHGVFQHLDEQVVGGKLMKSQEVFRRCHDGRAPEAPSPGRRLSGQGDGGIVRCGSQEHVHHDYAGPWRVVR
jgi:hypothetical protein